MDSNIREEAKTVSVAIVTRNRGKLLMAAIESIESQITKPDEIIVVDNASTDGTKEAIRKLNNPAIRYIFCSEIGVNAARNSALLNSTSDILAFIDDDAIADPTWLKEITCMFERNIDASAVVGVKENLFPDDFIATLIQFTMRDLSMARDRDGEVVLSPTIVDSCNLAIRRKAVFENKLLFDTSFIGGGDRHFGHQLFERGLNIVFCEKAVVRHYWPRNLKTYFRMRYWSGMITAHLEKKLGAQRFFGTTKRWGSKRITMLAWERFSGYSLFHRVLALALIALGQIWNKAGYFAAKRNPWKAV
jgi:glycosyltransferase involved in cell wall biosynthesis